MRSRCLVLVFVLLPLLFACAPASPPAERVKLLVSSDGMYRVSSDALRAAGVPVETIDPTTLQLFHRDRELAVRIRGEGNSLTIEFYGQASESPYSSDSVYWLRWGQEKGKRMIELASPPPAAAPVESFQEVLRLERPTLFVPQADTPGQPWFWQALPAPTTSVITLSLTSALPSTATVQVNLWGNTQDQATPDHHLQVFFNDARIADEAWDGQGAHAITGDIPAASIMRGDNLLRLVAPGDTAAMADVTLLSSVVVTYTRQLAAENDALTFRAAAGTYRVQGFTGDRIEVFDVSDSDNLVRVTNASRDSRELVFVAQGDTPRQWVAVGPSGYQSVARIAPMPVSDLRDRSRQPDYIIIAHPDFVAALEPLVKHRTQQGHQVAVVTTAEIYDEFDFGNESPLALRAYLQSLDSAPRFVLLVGKASYDYRDYTKAPNKNLVPTFLVNTPNLAQAGSDNWFAAASDSDVRPKFALGRIPAKTPAQVALAVSKILAYEAEPPGADWRQRAVFVTDDKDAAFGEMGDTLAAKLPAEFKAAPVSLAAFNSDLTAARAELTARWNAGAFLLMYIGHGSLDTWAEGPLFSPDFLPDIRNSERLPILITPTCLDGMFYHPQKDSLAEELLFKPDGGIIAGIVPTGLSFPTAQRRLMEALFTELFENKNPTLGEALLQAKQKVDAGAPEQREVIETFGILGDPALAIR